MQVRECHRKPEVAPPKPELAHGPPEVAPPKPGFEHDPTASVSIVLHDLDDPGMVRCNTCLQPVEQNVVEIHRKGAHSFTCKACNSKIPAILPTVPTSARMS